MPLTEVNLKNFISRMNFISKSIKLLGMANQKHILTDANNSEIKIHEIHGSVLWSKSQEVG